MPIPKFSISRRATLTGLGLLPVPASAQAAVCAITPNSDEGPYYVDPHLVRATITEGRPGIPLRMQVQVIEAGPCTPLAGARVDIWHADAQGLYSATTGQGDSGRISTVRDNFMRGSQMTDAAGRVQFTTIYPGWYSGRTPHIHLKIFADGHPVLTTQVYFPDALSEYIYTNVSHYRRPGVRDMVNAKDPLIRAESKAGRSGFCSVREEPDCYVAEIALSVNRAAVPPPAGFTPGLGFLLHQLLGSGLTHLSPEARTALLVPGLL